MAQQFLRPEHHLASLAGYIVPEQVRREFPDHMPYEVEVALQGRNMLCRCGEGLWRLAREGHEFVCVCATCGGTVSFGLHCFALFNVRKTKDADVIDLVDVCVSVMEA